MAGSIWNAGWLDCAPEGVIESIQFAGKEREGNGGNKKERREKNKTQKKRKEKKGMEGRKRDHGDF